ncbi:hypothetical protein F2Q68_00016750 [Brassica cretica]|uniref:Uncharacterized protein n=1 Tax=Brassica cretica TaxID=69181 RepID=A0A8S9HQY8_BRACR|nr:hypothetical protein F2Q68_00016750 [Brassica cretica]
MTPASGSPLGGTPIPRYEVLWAWRLTYSNRLRPALRRLYKGNLNPNLNFRDENQPLNTVSNKKCQFRAQVRPMPTLETHNSGTGANLPPTASGGDASMREKAKDTQT